MLAEGVWEVQRTGVGEAAWGLEECLGPWLQCSTDCAADLQEWHLKVWFGFLAIQVANGSCMEVLLLLQHTCVPTRRWWSQRMGSSWTTQAF